MSLGKHADALLFSSGPLSQTVYEAVVDIIKREGIHGLYSGLNSSLLGIAVTNGCVLRSKPPAYNLLHSHCTPTSINFGVISVPGLQRTR